MEPATVPVLPALDGASVAGIVPALLGGRGGDWIPDAARDADAVVLLVLDGLGWNALRSTRSRLPTLSRMDGGAITTVVPSTTATALTSICTGLAPAQHGVLGYRMVVRDEVLNVLRWTRPTADHPTRSTCNGTPRSSVAMSRSSPSRIPQQRVQRRTPARRADSSVGAPCRCSSSTAPGSSRPAIGSSTRTTRASTTSRTSSGCTTASTNGSSSSPTSCGELLAAFRAAPRSLVTADHGQVHLDRDDWIDLHALHPLVDVMAGDGRFRYLYARRAPPKSSRRRPPTCSDQARGSGRARRSSTKAGSGRGATGSVPGRLGDVVLASRDASAFVDPALPVEVRLRSGHGSLTADEMYVPLLAAPGRA